MRRQKDSVTRGVMGAGLVLCLLVVASGCGSTSPRAPRASSWRGSAAETAVGPWELDPTTMPRQYLYRVHYAGPEGELSFKLSLYLENDDRFRFQAADILGRKLWVLRVGDGQRALWIDYRQEVYCWAQAESGLDFVPLSRLPVDAFPRLLVGRMPARPAEDLREADGRLSYLDARGRTWTGTLAAGQVSTWSLLEAGEPVAWWQGGEEAGRPHAVFSDRRGQQQVRWREVISEPLVGGIVADSVPAAFREVVCGAGP